MAITQKTVLITGAARRLGRAIALELAGAGWNVAVHYNGSKRDADDTVATLRALGVRAEGLAADLADESETAALIGRSRAALGPLGALVNNASLFEHDDVTTMNRASWDRHMAVNLRAPVVLAKEFAAQMAPGMEGAIVNLLDQRVFKPTPEFLSYGVSKAGLHWLTVTLAQGLAPHIRVNAVAPGPTLPSARQSIEHFQRQSEATLLGHGATPEDIARATRYLVEASAVTGQTIAVDGGQHLAWRTADVTME
jgi:NAD(P)-dependent dehydrogenase (short-subunit alcohol dehydrogenase family)